MAVFVFSVSVVQGITLTQSIPASHLPVLRHPAEFGCGLLNSVTQFDVIPAHPRELLV